MSADIPGISINDGASIMRQPPDGPVREIPKGSSKTIMIVEDAGRPAWYGIKGIARARTSAATCRSWARTRRQDQRRKEAVVGPIL